MLGLYLVLNDGLVLTEGEVGEAVAAGRVVGVVEGLEVGH